MNGDAVRTKIGEMEWTWRPGTHSVDRPAGVGRKVNSPLSVMLLCRWCRIVSQGGSMKERAKMSTIDGA